MTTEERLEGNEIIGRYIGKSFNIGHIGDIKGKLSVDMNKRWLKYHRDWNELIPAVEKVIKELQEIPKAAGMIWDDDIHGECHAQQVAVEMTVLTWNITEVWSAVVKAINVINDIKNEKEVGEC